MTSKRERPGRAVTLSSASCTSSGAPRWHADTSSCGVEGWRGVRLVGGQTGAVRSLNLAAAALAAGLASSPHRAHLRSGLVGALQRLHAALSQRASLVPAREMGCREGLMMWRCMTQTYRPPPARIPPHWFSSRKQSCLGASAPPAPSHWRARPSRRSTRSAGGVRGGRETCSGLTG